MIEVRQSERNRIEGADFIDLFAGIGGFHSAMESFYANCVFASEWDVPAQIVYKKNFGIQPKGDITQVKEKDIPSHDILCGGFPCQAFSVSGKQKGFEDTRGTLFFDIARIAAYHQPKVLLLENVANFEKHNNGHTLRTVLETLDNIGYTTFSKVLNASDFGIPQIRKRIYFVAFKKELGINSFQFPKSILKPVRLYDFLETQTKDSSLLLKNKNYSVIQKADVFQGDLYDETTVLNNSIRIGSVNKGGQGDRIYDPNGHAITLSAYGGGNGAKTGLYLIDGEIRKLSPRECANIMGFPKNFILHENKNQSYKQFGNGVVIDVLQYLLKAINNVLTCPIKLH